MSHPSESNSFVSEALPAFISESQEQIESVEQLLLELEEDPANRELLDALFRCAHTVKGSAGIFGLDEVVAFTHHVETLLDQLREGQLALTPSVSTLLLQCNDQIRTLVASAASADGADPADVQAREVLVDRLQQAGGTGVQEVAQVPATEHPAQPTDVDASTSRVRGDWHLSVRFHTEIFRNGMDPLAILNYLRTLGHIPNLVCDQLAIPSLDSLNPEDCCLGFEIRLETLAQRDQIEAAFSFVRDDCTLHLIEPPVTERDYAELIAATPENPRTGDLLVALGAISTAQLEQGLASGTETPAETASTPTRLEPQEVEGEQVFDSAEPLLQKQAKARENRSNATPSDDNRFIRVHAEKLDAVINLLGELVIASAGGLLLARQSRERQLTEANQQISELVEEIRNGTLQLRMVPIGETFSRFRRVVRDTAAELGKDVRLDIVGGDTELDKSVVERIADPLMHLVRNALDHGLESPEERIAQGKAGQGTLTISARHESGSILIGIRDDGRGIDRTRVLQRAWERGLVERGVTPPDAEILNLIFAAGFSTAEKVTNLSGRGVGMDVVRRNIEALRGSVTLSSDPGKGSHIALRLPLTLAIIDGFLVSVGPSKFIFPLDAVVEVIESADAASAVDALGRNIVELRGQVLPVVSLRALYALDSPEPERCSIVVIRSGNSRYGVLVDHLLGQHQTVIKPLGRMFRSLRGMSGSSILGNGEVALIFDVHSLSQMAAQPTARLHHNPANSTESHTS
jgi:two-component system, chemotaxis family, sensor kinase CheA